MSYSKVSKKEKLLNQFDFSNEKKMEHKFNVKFMTGGN